MTTEVIAIHDRRMAPASSSSPARLVLDRAASQKRQIALSRWVFSLTVLAVAAAMASSCTCERSAPPPPAPPPAAPPAAEPAPTTTSEPPAPGTLREPAPSFSIALLPLRPPKVDVRAAVAELAAGQFPRLKIQSPGQPLTSLPVAIVGGYQLPGIGPDELSQSGRGLTPEARAALSRPVEATALEFHVDGADSLASLKQAQQLAGALVQRVDGVLLDGETRELFTPQVWKLFRMGGWVGELPAITSQIVLRRNGGDEKSPRLVSFGMSKFGLPDVAATDRPGAPAPPLAARLHLLCQLLVEGQAPSDDGWMTLDPSKVREAALHKALTGAGVTAPLQVRLRKASPQPGDPENRILELEDQPAR